MTKWIWIVSVVVVVFGIVPGMGIPGALAYGLAMPLAGLIWGDRAQEASIDIGPSLWGVAIYLTPPFGLSLIPSWFLSRWLLKTEKGWAVWLLTLGLWLVLGALIGLVGWKIVMSAPRERPHG